jgi:hypothetical protein
LHKRGSVTFEKCCMDNMWTAFRERNTNLNDPSCRGDPEEFAKAIRCWFGRVCD